MGSAPGTHITRRASSALGAWRSDGAARWVLIWPTVVLILVLSVFPLVASLALSLSSVVFEHGGIALQFEGFKNYGQLLFGGEQSHFLGVLRSPNLFGWAIVAVTAIAIVTAFVRSVRSGRVRPVFLAIRLLGGAVAIAFVYLVVETLASEGGRPGALTVTLIFVFGGIAIQYALGLGLAMLATQLVPGRRFFRIVFLIPLTITPVGVGYQQSDISDIGRHAGHQRVGDHCERHARDHETGRGGDQRQQQALGHQLTDDAAARGAE